MAFPNVKYCFENSSFRKVLFSPLKKSGFIPEKGSEIFVSMIPDLASVYNLARFFEEIGDLFQVKLMMQPDGQTNRGIAYVTYMNANLAKKAMIHLRGKPFIGNTCLRLQISFNNCRIFIGGIPSCKTKDEIWHELRFTYNIENIADIIIFKNYSNHEQNRGFAFLEFRTHEEASYFRAKYAGKLIMFDKLVLVDWSVPVLETEEEEMIQVKIIFLRNLDVTQTSEEFSRKIFKLVRRDVVDKVYKFKDYAYIHVVSREDAEKVMEILSCFYMGTTVEVTWAKPPNKFSDRSYRDKVLTNRRMKSSIPAPNRQPISILPGTNSLPETVPYDKSSSVCFCDNEPKSPNTLTSLLAGTTLQDSQSKNIFNRINYGASTSGIGQRQLNELQNFHVPVWLRNNDEIQPSLFHAPVQTDASTSSLHYIPSYMKTVTKPIRTENPLPSMEVTPEKWKHYFRHTNYVINEAWEKEKIIDSSEILPVIINLNETDSDDSDDSFSGKYEN